MSIAKFLGLAGAYFKKIEPKIGVQKMSKFKIIFFSLFDMREYLNTLLT